MTSMTSGPLEAHARAESPNKRQDDFDMAKLKKTLKQEQRQSLLSRKKVSKLTPAEIRSLNHSAGATTKGAPQGRDGRSSKRFATPPLTPDDPSLSHQPQHRSSQSLKTKRNNSELPTPPTSPGRERKGSNASAQHIHAPIPVSHAHAVNIVNVAATSRPASASSYRGVATYRGPEITRNGSLTMLHTPMQQIVSNPLSQFSRPRQSVLSGSPHKQHPDHRTVDSRTESPIMKQRAQTTGAVSQTASRNHSPIRPSDSPVSIEDGQLPERSLTPQPNNTEIPVVHVTPRAQPDQTNEEITATKKQKSNWRKTLAGSFEFESEPVLLKKEYRRRTFVPGNGYCLHAINYADTKPGEPPQLRDSLKNELPSAKTAEYNEDDRRSRLLSEHGQHPAVRPLNSDQGNTDVTVPDPPPSSNKKGKEREVEHPSELDSDVVSVTSSVPSYSRCSCCGRVQRAGGGFESDLSPVMENENLRTNFTFEMERISNPDRLRRSSSRSSNQRKYVPIIPMEVGNETKQARIEPDQESISSSFNHRQAPKGRLPGVAVNKPGDIIAPSSTPLAIMPRSREVPKFVRFASLHMKKEEKDGPDSPHKPESQLTAPQPVQLHRFGSLYGLRNHVQQQAQQPTENGYNNNEIRSQSTPPSQRATQPQTNGHHPLRSSFSAYEEDRPITPNDNIRDAIQKSHRSLPDVSKTAGTPTSPDFEADEGEPVVDLSSFDGSFVQKSLSRSATLLRESTIPVRPVGQIESMEDRATRSNPNGTLASSPQSAFPQGSDGSLQHGSDSQLSASNGIQPPRIDTNVATSMQSTDSATASASRKPTTVVRIVPSNTVSVASSPTSTTSKGQLKLGDWVLPESPQAASARGSVSSGTAKREVGIAL